MNMISSIFANVRAVSWTADGIVGSKLVSS